MRIRATRGVALRTVIAGVVISVSMFGQRAASATPVQRNCIAESVTPRAASIPANLPGFEFSNPTVADFHLFELNGDSMRGAEAALTVTPTATGLLKVAPTDVLNAGKTYELAYKSNSSCTAASTAPLRFMAKPAAPVPTRIGDVVDRAVGLNDAMVSGYAVRASFKLQDEMQPWVSVYAFTIVFDGNALAMGSPLPSSSPPPSPSPSPSGELVVVGYGSYPASERSGVHKHTIALRATLPFAPTLETKAEEMEFEWPAAPPPPIVTPLPPPTRGPTFVSSPPSSVETSSCTMGTRRDQSFFSALALATAIVWLARVGRCWMRKRS